MLKAGKIAALGAGAVLGAAGTAWAAFTPEGSAYPTGTDPYSLNVADFNGDGRSDVATINGTSGNVSVFLRQPGGFAQEAGSPVALDGGPSNAAVADVNGDGLPDLAVGLFVGNLGVDLLVRNAGGGFTKQSVDTTGGVSAIAAGDFNGDNRPDLAISRQNSGSVSILLNQGGTFTDGQTFQVASPGPIAVGDFNGDAHADLAVLSTTGNAAVVWLGGGNGSFTSEGSVATGVRPGGIVAADFNGDGRSDLAVSNYTDGTVSVFDSTGGGFAPEPGSPVAVSANPVGLALAGTDIAVAANSGAVDILSRNAAGGFTRQAPLALAGFQNGIGAGDFDGDGRPDLAVSQISAGTATPSSFSVFLNPAPPTATPTPTATLPPPVAGKTVNAARKTGTIRFRRPGSKKFVTLTAAAQIPVGSTIDTRKGTIAITAAQGKGKTATADFFDGLFKLTQTKGSKPATTLALTEKLSCPRRGKASAAAKKKKTRRLWGSGHGRFTTKGSYSAATVRGTKWLVQDTCTTTLTKVTRGVVSVRDFAKRKTKLVRAGHRYVARRRR